MSVTAVPLRPIKKGSLAKLWIGGALAVALAAGLAWAGTSTGPIANSAEGYLAKNAGTEGVVTTPSGLQYKVITPGKGAKPTDADVVLINYKGALTDGRVFDQNQQVPMEVSGVVPGFSEALKLMSPGAKYQIWIPPALGYGAEAKGDAATGIPANSVLVFDLDLIDFRSKAELQAMQMQEQMRQQQGGGGMPQGAMPPGEMPQGMPGQ